MRLGKESFLLTDLPNLERFCSCAGRDLIFFWGGPPLRGQPMKWQPFRPSKTSVAKLKLDSEAEERDVTLVRCLCMPTVCRNVRFTPRIWWRCESLHRCGWLRPFWDAWRHFLNLTACLRRRHAQPGKFTQLFLDLYSPEPDPRPLRPAVVLLHGGPGYLVAVWRGQAVNQAFVGSFSASKNRFATKRQRLTVWESIADSLAMSSEVLHWRLGRESLSAKKSAKNPR